jgi:lysophospholipase L1-like esterase
MIYAIGDSFTYGDELLNRDSAWPIVLSKKLNHEIVNLGKSASGNKRMVKRAIDAVIAQAEMIIIGWSDTNRQEFADDIGIYDIWAGRDWRTSHQINDSTHRINLIKYLTAYDTPEYYYAEWLRQVILTQNLCKLHNIPCIMFIACGAHENHNEYCLKFNKLVSAIDQTIFVDGMFLSAGDWTRSAPYGPNGHPLEAGHEIIANKIYEHIRHISWIP